MKYNTFKPLISLVMPLYNHEKFVSRAIKSIIDQTYENWELFVIDDGSTDDSAKIVKSFKDSRIKYSYQENQGVKNLAKTINKGLDWCSGEYITMMPSDDTWPKNRFKIQMDRMQDDVIVSYGNMILIDEEDTIIGKTSPKNHKSLENTPEGSILQDLLIENFIGEPTVLIKTSYLKQIGGYIQPEGMLAEDYPTMLELAKFGRFQFIDEYLANYRFHGGQMTNLHIVDMKEKDKDYVITFYTKLSDVLKYQSGWSLLDLEAAWNEKIARSYFSLGRRYAFKKDKLNALNQIKNSYKSARGFKLKIVCLISYMSILVGMNLEWLRLFNPKTLPLK